MENNLPARAGLLFYIILLLVLCGAVWAYFMPVEIAVPARGYVGFLGPAEAVGAPVTGTVRAVAVETAGSVAEGDVLLTLRVPVEAAGKAAETVVRASASGVLVWQRELLRGDVVQFGERLAVIHPASPVGVVAYLPDRDLGRVAAGLPVRITLDAYPYQDHGTLDGVVREITLQGDLLPGREQRLVLLVEIGDVPEGILLRPGMAAGVDVITGHTRLLRRLF